VRYANGTQEILNTTAIDSGYFEGAKTLETERVPEKASVTGVCGRQGRSNPRPLTEI